MSKQSDPVSAVEALVRCAKVHSICVCSSDTRQYNLVSTVSSRGDMCTGTRMSRPSDDLKYCSVPTEVTRLHRCDHGSRILNTTLPAGSIVPAGIPRQSQSSPMPMSSSTRCFLATGNSRSAATGSARAPPEMLRRPGRFAQAKDVSRVTQGRTAFRLGYSWRFAELSPLL